MRVELVGGPLDGRTIDADPGDEHPGVYMIVEGPLAHPEDPGARAVYEPEDGEDPARWVFRGWQP